MADVTMRRFSESRRRIGSIVEQSLAPESPVEYIAHYTHGFPDFSDPRPSIMEKLNGSADATLTQVGQRLSLLSSELEGRLAPALTGHLIRVVVQSGRGAFFCDTVVNGRYVVGACLSQDPARIHDADRQLCRIADDLRKDASYGSWDPGGFQRAGSITRFPARRVFSSGYEDHPYLRLFRQALSSDDLQCLVYCHEGRRIFYVDMFEDEGMERLFAFIDIGERRRFYHQISVEFDAIVGDFSGIVGCVLDIPLQRVVLDVEQGALYYYRLGRGEYIVGLTLDQARVSHADTQMGHLVSAVREQSAS